MAVFSLTYEIVENERWLRMLGRSSILILNYGVLSSWLMLLMLVQEYSRLLTHFGSLCRGAGSVDAQLLSRRREADPCVAMGSTLGHGHDVARQNSVLWKQQTQFPFFVSKSKDVSLVAKGLPPRLNSQL